MTSAKRAGAPLARCSGPSASCGPVRTNSSREPAQGYTAVQSSGASNSVPSCATSSQEPAQAHIKGSVRQCRIWMPADLRPAVRLALGRLDNGTRSYACGLDSGNASQHNARCALSLAASDSTAQHSMAGAAHTSSHTATLSPAFTRSSTVRRRFCACHMYTRELAVGVSRVGLGAAACSDRVGWVHRHAGQTTWPSTARAGPWHTNTTAHLLGAACPRRHAAAHGVEARMLHQQHGVDAHRLVKLPHLQANRA